MKLFGENNIVRVSFGHISKHKEDRQAEWGTYNVSMPWSTTSAYTNPPTLLEGVSTSYLDIEPLTVQNQIKLKSA